MHCYIKFKIINIVIMIDYNTLNGFPNIVINRLILHWFTMNVFMVLCSTLIEHNLTTKCAHKKHTHVFNTEKYTHIIPGIYLAICNFLLPVTAVKIGV